MSEAAATTNRAVSRLRAFARAGAREARERCEVCGVAIDRRHDHLVSAGGFELRCACGACALAPPTGSARVTPRLEKLGAPPSLATWTALGVPVALAFFVRVGSSEPRLVARYPGPAGTTAAEIEPAAAALLFDEIPGAAALAPETEALLVDQRRGLAFFVSIDRCFALAALLHGRLRAEVDAFFAGLEGEAAGG